MGRRPIIPGAEESADAARAISAARGRDETLDRSARRASHRRAEYDGAGSDRGGQMKKVPVSFRAEVEQRFCFLVDQYGFDEPEYSDNLLQMVSYHDEGSRISILLSDDTRDSAGKLISVSLRLHTAQGEAKAELAELVEAVAFAPRHRVARKAHTGDAMRATLDDNAVWLRRVSGILKGPDALDAMRKATSQERDSKGNPKRRPEKIRWKYS